MKFPVVEIFESIQGEGIYTGTPSVFIRTTGCNLRCAFKNSICDTAYTSHCAVKPKWDTVEEVVAEVMRIKSPETTHIVITGGEPMLHQKAISKLINMIDDEMEKDFMRSVVTIETNASIAPDADIVEFVDLWSLSPKLESSCCFEGKNISEAEQKMHETMRFNGNALIAYLIAGLRCQLKFVWCGDETMHEVDNFFEKLIDAATDYFEVEENDHVFHFPACMEDFNMELDNSEVLLMPAGQTVEQIDQNAKSAVAACIARGWRYCDRTHIRIWGDKKCV